MAYIPCPGCGTQISDQECGTSFSEQMLVCPGCACPVDYRPQDTGTLAQNFESEVSSGKQWKAIQLISGVLGLLSILCIVAGIESNAQCYPLFALLSLMILVMARVLSWWQSG